MTECVTNTNHDPFRYSEASKALQEKKEVIDGPSSPKISQIKPEKISIGDAVTIIGNGFGGSANVSSVYFGGYKASEYVFWSDTCIVCKVPKTVSTQILNVCVSVSGGVGGSMISASSPSSVISVQPAGGSGGSSPYFFSWNFSAKFGTDTSSNGKFLGPQGVTVDAGGNIYVADGYNYRVQKFDSGRNFLMSLGSYGTGNPTFNYPTAVAVDTSGNIYVADRNNHRIQKFSSGGSFLFAFGSRGSVDGQLLNPCAIATDSSANLYIADSGNNRIQKFDSSGNFIRKWGKNDCTSGTGNGEFNVPYHVAIDASNNLYVADYSNNRIQKFDSSGNFSAKWGANGGDGTAGSNNGEFSGPVGVAVDGSNNIYVFDVGNLRIQKLTSAGVYVTKWGGWGTGDGQFYNSGGESIGVDAVGNVYLADQYHNRVEKFDTNGNFLAKFGSQSTANGEFYEPWGISIDPSGNIYIADTANHRIQKFSSNMAYSGKWGKNGGDGTSGTGNGEFNKPTSLVFDSSGNIYIADGSNHRIQKFNSGMSYITKWGRNSGDGSSGTGNGEFNKPSGIAIDSVGYIYVSESGNNRVQKFNSVMSFVKTWGQYYQGAGGSGNFSSPQGIAVDSTGRIYVSDLYNKRFQIFDSDGNFLSKGAGTWGGGDGMNFFIGGIAVDRQGAVYVTEPYNFRVEKFLYY